MGKQKQISSYKLFISHPHFKHFLVYSFSYLIFGQVLTCLGPIFPYLAAHQGGLQTDYSFLFIARAAGFIIGSILTRIFENKLTLHQVIRVGIILMSIGCMLFGQFQNLFFKGFCIFLVSVGCAFKQISINVAALICFNGENRSSWLQAIHGCLGIGSLLGPILVYIFELSSLTILGFYTLITLVFYYILQNPENMFDMDKIQKQNNKKLQLPKYSLYLVSAAFFFAVGQTTVYGGWISSFIVRWDFSTKQKATFYSSFYWFSIALFRFLMVLVPGTASNKIKCLCFIAVINSFVSYFIIFNIDQQIGLAFMSFMYGLCYSIMFPLLFAISGQFGFQVGVKQSSLFIIWSQIGAGCLGVGVGQLMQWLSYNWLIYSMVFFNIALIYIIIQNTNFLNFLKAQRIKQEPFSDQTNIERDNGINQTKQTQIKQYRRVEGGQININMIFNEYYLLTQFYQEIQYSFLEYFEYSISYILCIFKHQKFKNLKVMKNYFQFQENPPMIQNTVQIQISKGLCSWQITQCNFYNSQTQYDRFYYYILQQYILYTQDFI